MAHEAWWQLGLDEVRLVPARVPPHRDGGTRFDPETRARLAELAVADHPALSVWRFELERDGPSWSVDTVRALAAERPDAALWFILGADQLATFGTWREPREILALARLAVAPRPGLAQEDAERTCGVDAARLDWLDMPPIALSATLIRDRLAAGHPVRYLVPPAVEDALGAMGLPLSGPAR